MIVNALVHLVIQLDDLLNFTITAPRNLHRLFIVDSGNVLFHVHSELHHCALQQQHSRQLYQQNTTLTTCTVCSATTTLETTVPTKHNTDNMHCALQQQQHSQELITAQNTDCIMAQSTDCTEYQATTRHTVTQLYSSQTTICTCALAFCNSSGQQPKQIFLSRATCLSYAARFANCFPQVALKRPACTQHTQQRE